MKESIVVKLLYKTITGRFLLKLLVNPIVSRTVAIYLKSSLSRWLVPLFIKKNRIDIRRYQVPEGGYPSFNDFFTRKMKDNCFPQAEGEFVCPCDGLLTVSDINEDLIFHIKHTEYSVKSLLRSRKLAEKYQGGTALIFRLTPAHYHRYIWSASGVYCGKKIIPGVLHSVQPVCHEMTKVFVQNSREYSVIRNSRLGRVVQMEVGALLVGKISNHLIEKGQVVSAGQEKGFFEYGGSTIVVLVENKIELPENIARRKKVNGEIPVTIGECL